MPAFFAALMPTVATGTPGPMLDVAQVYPNSAVAPRAMLAAADSYESAKEPRAAINVLRQMYFKYPAAPQKAQILESMARNYLTLPNRVEVAAARLAQGAALPGNPTLTKPLPLPGAAAPLPPGTTFAAALEQIRKVRTASASARRSTGWRGSARPGASSRGRWAATGRRS